MGKVRICITTDWEGEHLSQVGSFRKMRKLFGEDIPITHFICPNYFAGSTSRITIANKIKQQILPGDEIGLHIHCYRELIERIPGIPFRTTLNYHNTPGKLVSKLAAFFPGTLPKISGRGVPLCVYSVEEMEGILKFCSGLLADSMNLHTLFGFRAGGWLINDHLAYLLEYNHFVYDSSAVPPSIFSHGYGKDSTGSLLDDYGDSNGVFTEHVLKLWGYQKNKSGYFENQKLLEANGKEAISVMTQPYYIGNLLELPDNCALSDFSAPEKTVIPVLEALLKQHETNQDKDFLLVYGCHQEGEWEYKLPLIRFVKSVIKMQHPDIEFCTLQEISSLYGKEAECN